MTVGCNAVICSSDSEYHTQRCGKQLFARFLRCWPQWPSGFRRRLEFGDQIDVGCARAAPTQCVYSLFSFATGVHGSHKHDT